MLSRVVDQDFQARFSFPLDEFQLQAMSALRAGQQVLVCAPTGSGKTVVGEYAVFRALATGSRCFYTTPIKALSNQKYHDLCAEYGAEQIGLLTGDQSINGEAPIVVMTTEVLRNMLYAGNAGLAELAFVVMDEVHYLADRSRGAVWEEVILNLAPEVLIVGLSATISNAEEFGEWLQLVRGETQVIIHEQRPVPLQQHLLVGKKILPLFATHQASGKQIINPDLVQALEKYERNQIQNQVASSYHGRKTMHRREQVNRTALIRQLEQLKLLPTIVFVFSRNGCDSAAVQVLQQDVVLTTQAEAEQIKQIADDMTAEIPAAELATFNYAAFRSGLLRGIATHHAGMLPVFRHIVEKLFTESLVKVVFATETLALGINMPAKSVVIERLVKYNGVGHEPLTPAQYTQLIGRAGRRGLDPIGHAIVAWQSDLNLTEVSTLAATRTYPLQSTFSPAYNMAINLIQSIGYSHALELIEQSFAQFQANAEVVDERRKLAKQQRALKVERKEVEKFLTQVIDPDTTAVLDLEFGNAAAAAIGYAQLRVALSRREKAVHRQLQETWRHETAAIFGRFEVGTVVAFPGRKKAVLGVCLNHMHGRSHGGANFILEDGSRVRIKPQQLQVTPQVVGWCNLAQLTGSTHTVTRKAQAKVVRWLASNHELRRPRNLTEKSVQQQLRRLLGKDEQATKLQQQLKAHPVHHVPERETLVEITREYVRHTVKMQKLQAQLQERTSGLARDFKAIVELLLQYDYLTLPEDAPADSLAAVQITAEGQKLAAIHASSDLLIAQCLRRGIWDELDPAELAGAVSTCVFEARKDSYAQPAMPTAPLSTAVGHVLRIWEEIAVDEQRLGLQLSAEPQLGFAGACHQWTAGAPIEYALASAAAAGVELSPGDFVRSCRQVIDALEKVAATGYSEKIVTAARQAIKAMRRSVVAIGL